VGEKPPSFFSHPRQVSNDQFLIPLIGNSAAMLSVTSRNNIQGGAVSLTEKAESLFRQF
jgi:hypothetical protein